MILWLNGAFGAGNAQTVYELRRRLPGSYVYDPENAGFFLRQNLPSALRPEDFQDLPLWRALTRDTLRFIAERHGRVVIVSMTVVDRAYYEETIGTLAEEFDFRHVILWAERETLQRRLASRLEGPRSWGALRIDRCLRALAEDIPGEKLLTDGLSISKAARRVADMAGLTLTENRWSGLRRTLDRAAVQIRHIR